MALICDQVKYINRDQWAMSRIEFNKSLLTPSLEPSSATFTTADIDNKIALLQSGKPSVLRKNELSRWQEFRTVLS